MRSVNHVILKGRLSQDPVLKTNDDGGQWMYFALSTTDSWNDRITGELKEVTQWHNITVFDPVLAATHLRAGDQVYVEGRMETTAYHPREGPVQHWTRVILRSGYSPVLVRLEGSSDITT